MIQVQMQQTVTYSVPFFLRAEDPGTDKGRAALVLAAKARLQRDLKADGYIMAETSFVAMWCSDNRSGIARASGFKEKK